MGELISLQGVSVVREGRQLLSGVDWQLRAGEHWVVLGPNGAGKTSLLQVASGYLAPTSGTVRILGATLGRTDVRELRRRIGYAGPAPAALVRGRLPAAEVVVTGRDAAFVGARWQRYEDGDWERARDLLGLLHAAHLAERPYGTLSQGERQRVLIARSLMPDPELLLLDEPGSDLDLGARERLLAALSALASDRGGPGMVMVTHHVEEIPNGFDRVLLLADGRPVGQGPVEETLTGAALSACFGLPLRVERLDGRYRAWGGEPSGGEG